MTQVKTIDINPVLMNRETFYKYVGCGRKTGDSIAKAAKAERRLGGRVLIYRPAVDDYLSRMGDESPNFE